MQEYLPARGGAGNQIRGGRTVGDITAVRTHRRCVAVRVAGCVFGGSGNEMSFGRATFCGTNASIAEENLCDATLLCSVGNVTSILTDGGCFLGNGGHGGSGRSDRKGLVLGRGIGPPTDQRLAVGLNTDAVRGIYNRDCGVSRSRQESPGNCGLQFSCGVTGDR